MATDGLFDNVEMQDIVQEISNWQRDLFDSSPEQLKLPAARGAPAGAEQELAKRLVKLARTMSLDKQRDSPFALLAKENDIMWGGGMPDDTTVVVARVVSVPARRKAPHF
jgi:protein phosphatase PTC7